MSLQNLTNQVNKLTATWKEFQALCDRKIEEKQKNGSPDPLTLQQLEKINNSLIAYQDQITEAALMRPNISHDEHYEHKNLFANYLSKGHEHDLNRLEKKSLSASADAEGGYFITRGMTDFILSSILESSPMRKLSSVVEISNEALEIIEDYDNAYAGWTLETEERYNTRAPQISKKIIPVHELYAQPRATQRLLDDANIDIENWISDKLAQAFMKMENESFINGDGIGKPHGILSYPNGVDSNSIEQVPAFRVDGELTADSIIQLYFKLKPQFSINGKFLVSTEFLQELRMLKSNGRYLWQIGFEAKTPATLMGCEVIQCAQMPKPTKDSLPLAFGDFKAGYQIVDRQGIKILRDPFTDKPFVKFYATKRVGGAILNGQAIKLLKL